MILVLRLSWCVFVFSLIVSRAVGFQGLSYGLCSPSGITVVFLAPPLFSAGLS